MANYANDGNRWRMVFTRQPIHGQEKDNYVKAPFELVRFNVDTNPSAEAVIVPDAQMQADVNAVRDRRIYEGFEVWESERPGDFIFFASFHK